MPLRVQRAPTVLVKRTSYERAGVARAAVDELLGLTADEFRVEGDLIAIGPIYDAEALTRFFQSLDDAGLAYYEDYFELSGNWPAWLTVLVGATGALERSNPSQPQR